MTGKTNFYISQIRIHLWGRWQPQMSKRFLIMVPYPAWKAGGSTSQGLQSTFEKRPVRALCRLGTLHLCTHADTPRPPLAWSCLSRVFWLESFLLPGSKSLPAPLVWRSSQLLCILVMGPPSSRWHRELPASSLAHPWHLHETRPRAWHAVTVSLNLSKQVVLWTAVLSEVPHTSGTE